MYILLGLGLVGFLAVEAIMVIIFDTVIAAIVDKLLKALV